MLLEDRVLFRLAKSWLVRSWSLPRTDEVGRGIASWEGISCVCMGVLLWNLIWMR